MAKNHQNQPKNNSTENRPDFINHKASRQPVKKVQKSVAEYVDGILAGNRVLLSQAITLVESIQPRHTEKAQKIVEACLPHAGQSFRVGVTGTPGVGKSSFIEALGLYLCEKGEKIAVLAIDPSSQRSQGSILGDKTRMQSLSIHDNAFIRPSPAGDSLGGVARQTREIMVLCEAAGYQNILIETVGVGQSETAVHSMVDFFLLLLLPGAGDELQGIKKGVVEMADLIAINKTDGDRIQIAKESKKAYRNALHLFPPTDSGWIPEVMTCSALKQEGIDLIWNKCMDYQKMATASSFLQNHRKEQAGYWLEERIHNDIRLFLSQNPVMKKALERIESEVLSHQKTAYQGAKEVMRLLMGS